MRLIDADKLEDSVISDVCFWDNDDEDLILDVVKQQPTVDAAPVAHGRWVEKPFLMGTSNFCSVCGDNFGMPHGKYRYCPKCGTRMDLEMADEM